MTLVASSCTDVLDQMPTTEDTSKEVYADAANYKKVLAKIYASYVLAGQGQGEITETSRASTNKTFPVAISICKKPLPMK